MYELKVVGKYNVDYAGFTYDGRFSYQMVIVSKFEGAREVSRKTLYFRDGMCMPPLTTEEQIEKILQYPNNAKI